MSTRCAFATPAPPRTGVASTGARRLAAHPAALVGLPWCAPLASLRSTSRLVPPAGSTDANRSGRRFAHGLRCRISTDATPERRVPQQVNVFARAARPPPSRFTNRARPGEERRALDQARSRSPLCGGAQAAPRAPRPDLRR